MDIVERLDGYIRAYPLDIFPEPTSDDRMWLKDAKPGLQDRIAASMARHMLPTLYDAHATITALRKRVEELEGALEPLVLPHQYWMDEYPDGALCPLYNKVTWGDHRRARAALRAKGGE